MRVYIYLTFLYVIVLVGMYRALVVLGPLSTSLLRYAGDPMQHGYKIFFFTMPNAPVVYLSFIVVLISSIVYLKTRDSKWDILAASSAKIGIIFTTILLISGAIFSNLAWGAYWNWDPRQTTTLFLWFILAAYLSLRSAIDNPQSKARTSAILGIFGFVGVPLAHISATIWTSNHPQLYDKVSGAGFKLGNQELITFILMVMGAIMIYLYLIWITFRTKKMEIFKNGRV